MKLHKRVIHLIALLLILSVALCSCDILTSLFDNRDFAPQAVDLNSIPEFNGSSPYVIINENVPYFTDEEIVTESFEYYSPLDSLGRCVVAVACIGVDLMPTEDRGSISGVKPSGWLNKNYGDLISGGDLYNRCHLIGFQLTGENANERNLITGTRYMNVSGMLKFENMVADYLKEETDCHVMYRVTPVFKGSELVARGCLIEAYSVEDEGYGISFCVYVYNNQPGIVIDYATGDSWIEGAEGGGNTDGGTTEGEDVTFYVNTNTGKFHTKDCRYATGSNVTGTTKTKEQLIGEGKSACGVCNP